MKLKPILLLLLLWPAVSFCQSIDSPLVGSSDDNSTTITKIEVTKTNTIITFTHIATNKGNWVQLNKSIYLQDANGEKRYACIKSEGIPLRPLQHIAASDNEQLVFKVYFEKLEPGTKEINVIERALSPQDRALGTNYFNYYNVSLEKTDTVLSRKSTQVRLLPPDAAPSSPFNNAMGSMLPMINNMYASILNAQIAFYSDPAKVTQLAKITKSYYDALIGAGFSADQAVKIITSKQLISMDGK